MGQRIGSTTGAAGRLVRACAAVGLAGAAACLAALPALATTGTWSQKLTATIPAGSTLRAGYGVSMPGGGHPAATLTVAGGSVAVSVKCADGSQSRLVVPLPQQSYAIPAGSKGWFPSGDSASAATYQGSVAVPSRFCGGGSGSSTTVAFSADFTSTDSGDKVNVRFHVADGSSGGGWSGTGTVVPSAAAPAPAAPSRPAAPAPTRSQTPAPSRPAAVAAPVGRASAAAPVVSAAPGVTAAPADPDAPAPAASPSASASPAALTWWITPSSGHVVPGLQDTADARPSTLLATVLALLVGGAAWMGQRRVTAAASRSRRRRC